MLSKRFIIETINDQLKNISFIEHSRHRSMKGFMLNLLAGLVAYCLSRSQVNYFEFESQITRTIYEITRLLICEYN
jgi:hypothetical protein